MQRGRKNCEMIWQSNVLKDSLKQNGQAIQKAADKYNEEEGFHGQEQGIKSKEVGKDYGNKLVERLAYFKNCKITE